MPSIRFFDAMPGFTHILVPVDFSALSEQAFRFGLLLARPENATVHLMHDIEIPTETITGATTIRDEMDEAHADSERRLNELMRIPEAEGIDVRTDVLKSTDPKRSILTYAEEREIDLVVLGTHGRTSPVEKVIGSTAERVMRRSPCPTVTVRGDRRPERIGSIVVPVDLSKYSAPAVEHAVRLASIHGARVLILHAESDEAETEIRDRLQELYRSAGGEGSVDVAYAVSTDAIDEAVSSAAMEHNADLILMITHGRTGIKRTLTGSVAENVARTAPCPVMTYRTALEK